jgi:toxin secretion/phage lysis holin
MINQTLINSLPEAAKLVLAGMGTLGIYLFGGYDAILQALIALVVLDYITGVLAAYYEQKLNSEVGFKGIAKKICIFMLVAMATLLDSSSGLSEPILRTAVIMFFIANEGLSILENSGRLGVPLPDVLRQALEKLHPPAPRKAAVLELESESESKDPKDRK